MILSSGVDTLEKPWRLFEKVLSNSKNSLKTSVSCRSLLGALGMTLKEVLLITLF